MTEKHICISAALGFMLAGLFLSRAAAQEATEQPLPGRIVIDVDSPERALYRIAIPNLLGGGAGAAEGGETLRGDLTLSSLFQVLDPKSFIANLDQEALGITKAP